MRWRVDLVMGTFGKVLGGFGASMAGSGRLRLALSVAHPNTTLDTP